MPAAYEAIAHPVKSAKAVGGTVATTAKKIRHPKTKTTKEKKTT